jgi:hypothetical protein
MTICIFPGKEKAFREDNETPLKFPGSRLDFKAIYMDFLIFVGNKQHSISNVIF